MSPLARVVEEHVGDVAIAAVDGEIDASNARDLGERLRSSLTNRSLALVVDLAQATYIDSAGINVLFALELELRQRRQQLHLVLAPSDPVARVLAIAGVQPAIATHATRGEALDAVARE